jgi:F-type H+-transporting ATPase subunit gamma
MQTMDSLQKRIKTTSDLLAVVKTMKSLAAVNIRHFDRAAQSMMAYAEVVEQAWSVLFRSGGIMLPTPRANKGVVLVIGSDQGMCGQFNEVATQAGLSVGKRLDEEGISTTFWSAGARVGAALEDNGKKPQLHFSMPGTLGGVDRVVTKLVERMAEAKRDGAERFHVVYNAQNESEGYSPKDDRILPLDAAWGKKLASAPWPGRCLPQTLNPGEIMFSGLFAQHLFVSLYGAITRSMAAENSARLAAMHAAEKNIDEMRTELQGNFRQTRQNAITGELLDIMAGFEAMT